MSKVLNNENQRIAWEAAGYEGDPALEVTMLDVYEWEEEVMECLCEIRDSLKSVLGDREQKEQLEQEQQELQNKKQVLHEVLVEEGYPNGLYYEEEAYLSAA